MSIRCPRIFCMILAFWIWKFSSPEAYAQGKYSGAAKKDVAVQVNMGASNLLGDLGGADAPGTHGIRDFDPEAIRYTVGTSFIYMASKPFALRSNLQFTQLHGSDNYTLEDWRRKRNITVNTSVIALSTLAEIRIPLSKVGIFGRGPFMTISSGIGAIFFNPTGNYNGTSYNLHEIGTEGQRLNKDIEHYSRLVLNVPFGAGFRYAMDKNHSFGFEVQSNKTFTDYLDDVSNAYYDNDAILADQGEAGAYLADPNLTGNKRKSGAGRGNPNEKDHFLLFTFNYRYTFHQDRLF